jgi:hypothetical protein
MISMLLWVRAQPFFELGCSERDSLVAVCCTADVRARVERRPEAPSRQSPSILAASAS